jgi:CelD/BcsL family acetyltransferase involved in cellulose biosynthesis
MKRAWLAERGLPSRVIECPDWEDALVGLAQQAHTGLRVARLQAGETTVAIEVALAHGRSWCAFLGATAPDFAKAGPGHVQMAETMAHCRTEGHDIYDLLAPAEPYKRVLGTGSVAVTDHAAALGPVGRLAMLLVQSKPVVKQYVDLIPPRLRAALLTMRRG